MQDAIECKEASSCGCDAMRGDGMEWKTECRRREERRKWELIYRWRRLVPYMGGPKEEGEEAKGEGRREEEEVQ